MPENVTWPRLGYTSVGFDYFKYFDIAKNGYLAIENYYFWLQFEYIIFEETDEYRLERTVEGITHKDWKKGMGMPASLAYPIKCRKDFDEYRERQNSNVEERLPEDWGKLVKEINEQGDAIPLSHVHGFFAVPRELKGVEAS